MSICRQLVARGLLLTLLGLAGWARAETLVIAGDIWCPINCQPGAERPGIFVELAREIFAESGITVEYQALNWARTLHRVRRGELNAAIGAGVERGVTDPNRVAIGGHSYGAFMTANLLAHSNLFKAGIARSGAYNRSLTPFGFQMEQRTLWDDPELYSRMSPFFHADLV